MLQWVISERKMRDVGVKLGIVDEKTRNFWFEQQFLKSVYNIHLNLFLAIIITKG